ncbi:MULTISPECIES: cytochrome C oxidase subunit IV family protein [Flavobacteriaceae]|uniref:Cytochrome C oxidase subunit IV n=2 Tax=Flavobacteriaceae TaxID=49546 RepID=A0A4Y8AV95_9FLAO|nr:MULTISPECIES: cytochrome C oxidase subunit IV family protein [Flavobacteriaceae]TEW75290.1 hypothetical protein E2488_07175 [Gramella jeungdoensis]GGK44039.1 hypothetical protein GCM10007963_10190 [Lutibacter litoralis]
MKKYLFLKVWVVLIMLTITTTLVSNSTLSKTRVAILILGLSVFKFFGVSFYFMELKKAHIFWKISITIFVVFLTTILVLMR